jgi:hypothetical protein
MKEIVHTECYMVRGDIFRPRTRRFGEITVLYTQLFAKKSGVHWVRSVGKQYYTVQYYSLEMNKAIV